MGSVITGTAGSGRLTVGEIITRVKRQFGDEAGSQITDADIIRWVNDAQREVAQLNNLLQIRAKNDINAGQSDYALPDNILSLHSVKTDKRKLTGITLHESDDLADINSEGEPSTYWQWASTLTLWPKPTAYTDQGLTLFYTRQPVRVTDADEIPELPPEYHNRLVDYCIAQAYELDSDWQSYSAKMQMFNSGVSTLRSNDHQKPQHATYEVITTDPSDYGNMGGYGSDW